MTNREAFERLNDRARETLRECSIEDAINFTEKYAAYDEAKFFFMIFTIELIKSGMSLNDEFVWGHRIPVE